MAAPVATERVMQSFGYKCFPLAICPPLQSDPEQHSDKNNLFHLYRVLCADPLAAYKICEILVLLCNCQHVI